MILNRFQVQFSRNFTFSVSIETSENFIMLFLALQSNDI